MSSVEEIEKAIERLSPDELEALRKWFAEHDAKAWDQQFERDASSRNLDKLAEQASRDHREGRSVNFVGCNLSRHPIRDGA